MTHRRAIDQYLAQYALLPMGCPELKGEWQHVMVLPCFDEEPLHSSTALHRASKPPLYCSYWLLIVPLSRPPEVNQPVREALAALPTLTLQLGYDLHEGEPLFFDTEY